MVIDQLLLLKNREREFDFNLVQSQAQIKLYNYTDISSYWNAAQNKYDFHKWLWCSYYEIAAKFNQSAARFFIVRVKDTVRLYRTLEFIYKTTGRQDIGFAMDTEAFEIITEIQPDDTFTDMYIRQHNSVDGSYNTRFLKHDKTGLIFPSNGNNNTYCGLWYGNGFYYEYMKQQCEYYVLATSETGAPSGYYHVQIIIK